jgi:hypothetical protein
LFEDLEGADPVTGEGARFHLCPHRIFAQLIEPEHAIGKLLDLAGIAGPSASVDQNDQRILDRRKEASLLAILPDRELTGVGDVEPVEEVGNIERRSDLRSENITAEEAIEVEREMPRGERDLLSGGLQRLVTYARPENRERRGERVTGFLTLHTRPQQLGKMLTMMKPPALDSQVHE